MVELRAQDLVGRQEELGAVRRRLAEAAQGAPATVIITGEPGIGKTALARAAAGDQDVVLVALCDEQEAALPFGMLDQLLRSAAALGRGATDRMLRDARDPLAAGAVLLEAIGDLQTSGPVVLVVDDLQWADPPSVQALLFVLRRLRADRVLCLLTVRSGAPLVPGIRQLQRSGLATTLELEPLSTAAMAELAERHVGPLPQAAVERLVSHTDGNPLYAQALLRAVAREDLLASRFGPLPAPESFASDVEERMRALPADVRAVVAAGAVLGQRFSVETARRVAKRWRPDAQPSTPDEVGGEGLLVVDGDGAQFRHPLIRAAVYHALPDRNRRSLHRAAAAEVGSVSVALRHEAAAASPPDPELAARLRHHAHAIQREGPARSAEAAATWLDVARLEDSAAHAQEATLHAVAALLTGGQAGDASALFERTEGFEQTPLYRVVEGELAYATGRPDQAVRALTFAWEQLGGRGDPTLAGRAANLLAAIHLRRNHADEAALWAQRAIDAGPHVGITSGPRSILVLARAGAGDVEGACAAVADLPQDPAQVPTGRIGELVGRALLRVWTEDLDAARTDLLGLLARIPGAAVLPLRIVAETYLALAEHQLGDWDTALLHAEAAASAADDGDQLVLQAPAHALAAVVLARRGHLDDAARHVAAAQHAASSVPDNAGRMVAGYAAALLHEQQDEPARAATDAREILEATDGTVVGPIDLVPWRVVGASALARLGELDEARRLLAPYAEAADRWRLVRAQVRCRRVEAELASAEGRSSAARSLLEGAARLGVAEPFERARVRLDLGALALASDQRRAALDHLTAARQGFRAVRATPWVRTTDAAIEACAPAGAAQPDDPGPADDVLAELTSQERAIALLVARGLRNRDVAAELVISVKTVEYHLSHVYQKLQLANRAQLAALIAVQN